jgi:hypothetical protein
MTARGAVADDDHGARRHARGVAIGVRCQLRHLGGEARRELGDRRRLERARGDDDRSVLFFAMFGPEVAFSLGHPEEPRGFVPASLAAVAAVLAVVGGEDEDVDLAVGD